MVSKFAISCLTALVIATGTMTSSMAAGGAYTRGCASRDMQILIMLETSAISQQVRSDAVRTVMHARIMCFEGHVVDALAVYDNVAQSIISDLALSRP